MQPAGTAAPTTAELMETLHALRRVAMGMKARFTEALRLHGVTFPQWLLLRHLAETGRATVRELAERMEVTPANITGLTDRLEREALVSRSRSSEDRRVVYVRLTERGHERMAAIRGTGTSMVLRDAFEGWTPQELATFREMLARVRLEDPDCAGP